jgi:hypothetical protein
MIVAKTYQKGYLVVLDACRYDVFAEIAQERYGCKPLKLDTRCHCTAWWYRKYWRPHRNDVHLISANPVPFNEHSGWNSYRHFKSATWADFASARARAAAGGVLERLSLGGVNMFDPVIVLEVFAAIKQPGEQYLLHLIPPHLPFQGEKGRALFERLGLALVETRHIYKAIQDHGRAGNWDEVRECYKENIEYALDALERYAHLFRDGRLVITADHAELIGDPSFDENGLYRHAKYVNVPDLWMTQRTVPWLEVRL